MTFTIDLSFLCANWIAVAVAVYAVGIVVAINLSYDDLMAYRNSYQYGDEIIKCLLWSAAWPLVFIALYVVRPLFLSLWFLVTSPSRVKDRLAARRYR